MGNIQRRSYLSADLRTECIQILFEKRGDITHLGDTDSKIPIVALHCWVNSWKGDTHSKKDGNTSKLTSFV